MFVAVEAEIPVLRPHRSRGAAKYRLSCDNDYRLTVSSMVRRLFYQTEAEVSFLSKKSGAQMPSLVLDFGK
jgi:hypothetical protein